MNTCQENMTMISYTTFVVFICFVQLVIANSNTCHNSVTQLQNAINLLQVGANGLGNCCTCPLDPCSEEVIAYYPFDRSYRDVCHGYNGVKEGNVELSTSGGVMNGAAYFEGAGRVRVARLNGYQWGTQFSVSLFFRRTGEPGNYQGLINNGYHSYGSWEVRMGRENNGQMLGGGIITQGSTTTWDYVHITASFNHWHHVVMTYNGTHLDYYYDNVQQVATKPCCQGDIVAKNIDVVIGQAGHGKTNEYFYGYIDEVKLFKKYLSADEVQQLYQLKNI